MYSDKDRAMITGNRDRKFCEVLTCGFWDKWADWHTYKQTDRRWSQYFAPLLKTK